MFPTQGFSVGWLRTNAGDIEQHFFCEYEKQVTLAQCGWAHIYADITPVFKKGCRGSKDNYQPVSILVVTSKTLEKLLCKQLTLFIDKNLWKFQCGFRKRYSTQHWLLAMKKGK